MKKHLKVISKMMLIWLLILQGCSSSPNTGVNGLEMIVFKADKADAIIVRSENHIVMIDTGLDDNVNVLISYLSANNIEKIDYLLITHFDKDHVGGADKIIQGYDVENIIIPNYTSTSKQTVEFIDSYEAKVITPIVLEEALELELEDISFNFYPTQLELADNDDNNHSIVTMISYQEKKLLLTGDAEKKRIKELLGQFDLRADLIKMPHHGRIESNSVDLIDAVKPSYALITCSNDEYADEEIISMLKDKQIDTYFSSNGNIIVSINDSNLKVSQ